jgi:hypothetical protein
MDSPEKKGFSGLASLVSDVSSVVDRNSSDARDAAANATAVEFPAGAVSNDTSGSREAVRTGADRDAEGTPDRRLATGGVSASASGERSGHGGSSRVLLWFGAFAVGAVALFAIFSADRQGSSGSARSSAPTVAPSLQEQSENPRVYAVAALNANLRALPSTRSKVIGTLKRGAPVVALDQRDGFIKLRTNGYVEGWISSDIVIEMADLTRLQSTSPADYIAARERFMPIEKLTEHLDRMSPPGPFATVADRRSTGRCGDHHERDRGLRTTSHKRQTAPLGFGFRWPLALQQMLATMLRRSG